MRSKTDFYRLFFEQLARKGFDVKRSQSSDYIADIYYKNQLVAYFSKADTIIQNPFIAVKDKVMRLINDTAQNTAIKAGICRDCPYTDANEKLPNGSYKLAEYNGVTLACKEHHLFGYVFSTYRTAPDSGEMLARQVFYNKEFAGQDFAKRSGLVDEKALFSEEELRILHAGLVKMSILDQDVSNDARESVERILDKIEEIMPELREANMDFDFDMEFGLNDEMEMGGYEGVVFTDGGREVIYYNQLDERWADTMYGTSGTIGEAGCGPTAMAIVISTLTGTPHDPVELSEWSVANGHRCEGNGS